MLYQILFFTLISKPNKIVFGLYSITNKITDLQEKKEKPEKKEIKKDKKERKEKVEKSSHKIFQKNLKKKEISEHFLVRELVNLRDETKEAFLHSYDSYIKHAFPFDELKPLSCLPR